MYFNKIVESDPYLVSKTGTVERTVRIIGEGADLQHEKLASECLHFSHNVRSKPGSTYILVLAMGASEFYGPNRNGDAFKESELVKHHKTFETNAHVFKSHVNKDPAKSIGSVTKSFYNNEMHRVELILELVDSKCPEIISKIRNNQDVAVSMGCRIKYDVCTICGNKAPTRADYCKHLKYELNEILPDGRIVAADNPSPTFFDISVVWRPADKTGYMMKKVANFRTREKGESSASLSMKVAAKNEISKYLNKAAEIDKIVTGVGINPSSVSSGEQNLSIKWLQTIAPKMVSTYNRLNDEDIVDLSKSDFSSVLKGLSDKNIFLMTPEFLDLLFLKIMGSMAPSGLASKMVGLQSSIFGLLSRNPESASKIIEDDILDPKSIPSQDLEKKIAMVSRNTRYTPSILRPTVLPHQVDSVAKTAGLAACTHALYTVGLLSSCDPTSRTKLAHITHPDFSEMAPLRDKLSYLLHRTTDLYTNLPTRKSYSFTKLSSGLPEILHLSLNDGSHIPYARLGHAILNS